MDRNREISTNQNCKDTIQNLFEMIVSCQIIFKSKMSKRSNVWEKSCNMGLLSQTLQCKGVRYANVM